LVPGLSCEAVLRELSNYIDRAVGPELYLRMEAHFQTCESCAATLETARDVIQALNDDRLIDVTPGYNERLYRKLKAHLASSDTTLPCESERHIQLGITPDRIELGSHLIYFWESDEEFGRGVRFLEPGLTGRDHCIIFGHDEAIDSVFQQLLALGFDTASLLRDRRITVLRRQASAHTTLSDIEDLFKAAVRTGAPAIRYLGNLGFGKAPLPGTGVDDVLELEAKATALARRFPAVVVCMYDINTLPGRLILKGGFQTHPLAVCGHHLQRNPYYIPEGEFLRDLRPAL
jgi:MEDS: MEthanogen/methylotroph, DcmR Sensory domain/Putative zinc-finger